MVVVVVVVVTIPSMHRALKADEDSGLSFASDISGGHVVISNYSSALEVLLLAYWAPGARFAFPVAVPRTGSEEATVVVLDFFSAVAQACGSQVRSSRCVRPPLALGPR